MMSQLADDSMMVHDIYMLSRTMRFAGLYDGKVSNDTYIEKC